MELSENIYEDLHGRRPPKNEEYANDLSFRRPRKVKGLVWSKLALGLLALLCVVLLLVIVGLTVKNKTEKQHWEAEYSNLKTEKAEQETKLNHKLNRLHDQYNQLETNFTKEMNVLHEQYNQVKLQHSKLQTSHNLTVEEGENMQLRLCKLEMDIKEHAVDVTLDPDTAYNYLILSANGKQVRDGNTKQNRPDNPKRFNVSMNVLGKQGFSSGRFYYEVRVSGTTWDLGVTRKSSNRKGKINWRDGYWTIWVSNGTYRALASSNTILHPVNKVDRVGVFVDYEAGLVSFYNAKPWDLLYSFKHVHFNDTIYPFFRPSLYEKGKDFSPLTITYPVLCNDQHIK